MQIRYCGGRRARLAKGLALALGALFFTAAASAEDSSESMFSLDGFGTLGMAHSSLKRADFAGSFYQPNGAGHWRSWAVSTDSKLGVQLNARFSDRLSGVVQLVSQYNYDSTYTPQVEWANLAYRVTPDFDLRLGRFAASTFLVSEAGLVGYTYPWIRPPQELYVLLPTTNKDGIDALYRFNLGAVANAVQASYGRSVKKIPDSGEFVTDHYLDVHNTADYGPATVRLGYTAFDGDFHNERLDTLFDSFHQFGNSVSGPAGQQALAIEHQRHTVDSPYSIVTIGASYDPRDWLLMAEWARASTRNPVFASDTTAWYVTGGYRFAAFMPYLTLAQVRPKKLNTAPIPSAGLLPAQALQAAALNSGLDAVIDNFAFAQDNVSLGVRWDIRKSVDFKMQYEHLRTGSGSSGRLINAQPAFRSGDTANVISFVVDFVF